MSKITVIGGVVIVLCSSLASISRSEVLLSHGFDAVADDAFPFGPSPIGRLDRWEGSPQGANGLVRVSSAAFNGASGKSVALTDTNAAASNAAAIVGVLPTLNAGLVEMSWSLRPEFSNIFSLTNIGGGKNWGTSASQLMVINGDLVAGFGDGTDPDVDFVNVGTFTAGNWVDVRYLFDLDAQTFDLFIDGVQKLNDYGFEDDYAGNFSTDNVVAFDIVSDLSTNDRAGAATLYVDDVLVQTVTAVPEPASLSVAMVGTVATLLRRTRRQS